MTARLAQVVVATPPSSRRARTCAASTGACSMATARTQKAAHVCPGLDRGTRSGQPEARWPVDNLRGPSRTRGRARPAYRRYWPVGEPDEQRVAQDRAPDPQQSLPSRRS